MFWNLIFTLLPTIILRSSSKSFLANNLRSQVLETSKYSTFLNTWSFSHLISIALRMKIGSLYYFTLYQFPTSFPYHFHVSSLVAQICPSFYLAYTDTHSCFMQLLDKCSKHWWSMQMWHIFILNLYSL